MNLLLDIEDKVKYLCRSCDFCGIDKFGKPIYFPNSSSTDIVLPLGHDDPLIIYRATAFEIEFPVDDRDLYKSVENMLIELEKTDEIQYHLIVDPVYIGIIVYCHFETKFYRFLWRNHLLFFRW